MRDKEWGWLDEFQPPKPKNRKKQKPSKLSNIVRYIKSILS